MLPVTPRQPARILGPGPALLLTAAALLGTAPALAQTANQPTTPAAADEAGAAAAPATKSGLRPRPWHEASLQWAPSGMSNDKRSFRLMNINIGLGNGWGLGGSLGYGHVRAPGSSRGAFAALRVRYDLAPLAALPSLRPRVSVDYGGGTTFLGRSSVRDLYGVQVGAAWMVAAPLLLTADWWSGSGRFVVDDGIGAQQVSNRRQSVQQVRFGLGIAF